MVELGLPGIGHLNGNLESHYRRRDFGDERFIFPSRHTSRAGSRGWHAPARAAPACPGSACRTGPPAPRPAGRSTGAGLPADTRSGRLPSGSRILLPGVVRRPASCSMTFASSASGPAKLPPPNLSRTTGWRSDQSWRSWMYSPANSSSLPSNSSFSVSRSRLLPNRRGRDRK